MNTEIEKPVNGFTALVIPPINRALMLEQLKPQYDRVVAHHVTKYFGLTEHAHHQVFSSLALNTVHVYAHLDSLDGIECFLVTVNGSPLASDGRKYHITWSLDPDKYKPYDSNALIETRGNNFETFVGPGFVANNSWIPNT